MLVDCEYEEGEGMSDGAFAAGVVVGFILATGFAIIPMGCQQDQLKAKAVELGSAEWKVDPKNGTTQFQWKEPKP